MTVLTLDDFLIMVGTFILLGISLSFGLLVGMALFDAIKFVVKGK